MILFGPVWLILPLVAVLWLYRSAKADVRRERQARRDAIARTPLPPNKLAGVRPMRINEDIWP